MYSIVCTCVIETHLWKQLSLHHFPILFQQSVSNLLRVTALHLFSAPPTFPYLCSCLFLSTSPFPPSMYGICLIYLVVSFPSPPHPLSFPLSIWLNSFLPPVPQLAFILNIIFSWHFFNPSYWHFSLNYLYLAQNTQPSFLFISRLPLFMSSILSLSARTATCCKQGGWPGPSTPWQVKLP